MNAQEAEEMDLHAFLTSALYVPVARPRQQSLPSPMAIEYYGWIPEQSGPGFGNLLVVLCRSNVAKSLSMPTHPSPPYFYTQQPLKHVNLILSKLSF